METKINEIADGIYRLSTLTDAVPGGFTFNQFLVRDEQPLLFHAGLRGLFPSVSQAIATVMPVEQLRWVSFGHWEADESGAMNLWRVAIDEERGTSRGEPEPIVIPAPLVAHLTISADGTRLAYSSVLATTNIDTPHVPHGWDAGLLYEETTGTLLCGDLFTQVGDKATTEDDIVGPAAGLEDMMSATSLTPRTAPSIRGLADLNPSTLALMHGPSFAGDCAAALRALADDYDVRLEKAAAG